MWKILSIAAFVSIFIYLVLSGWIVSQTYNVISVTLWLGLLILIIAVILLAIFWYMNRWRRWWLKFLKTFIPKGSIHHFDWKMQDSYFRIFDYGTNAQYGLRTFDGVFEGRARILLDRFKLYGSARLIETLFADIFKENDIQARVELKYDIGCIYAEIIAETDYKTMDSHRLAVFRAAFYSLIRMSYRGDYYVEYQGELGTILYECTRGHITRAIMTEPRVNRYMGPDCGSPSDELYSFVERGVDWTEGLHTLTSRQKFFDVWREHSAYKDCREAYSFFVEASNRYFASIADADRAERVNSQWDIENAAKYLIAHNETELIKRLMENSDETTYWAARCFNELLPAETTQAASTLVHHTANPAILTRSKRLLNQLTKDNR